MAVQTEIILNAMVAVSILLFAAKLLSELFARLHLPIVLGELGAGIILGPVYFGYFTIEPSIIEVDNAVLLGFAQIGAIVILFVAGLEMPFRDFVKGGMASFTTGASGVIFPFFGGLLLFTLLGFGSEASLMVAATLTATSIAISIETLREVGRLNSPEGRLVIGAAVVDDVLAIAVLGVVVSLVSGGRGLGPIGFVTVIGGVLFFFAALLVVSAFVAPRLTDTKIWRTPGSLEAVVTALFFGMAAVAATPPINLSPIVGSFAVGMGLAGANVAQRMRDYTEKLQFIFRPLFFAVIGAQVDLSGISLGTAFIGVALVAIAIGTKIVGCGVPATYFLKSRTGGRVVGVAMVSRGEVGLIVAGLALASGAIETSIYAVVIMMVVTTTILAPIWLKRVVAVPVSIEGIAVEPQPKPLTESTT